MDRRYRKMRMKWSLIVLLGLLMISGGCNSSKEEKKAAEERGKPSNEVAKPKASESVPADALAKVGDTYIRLADYQKQLLRFSPKLAETEPGRRYIVNHQVENMLIAKEAEVRGWTKDPVMVSKIEEFTRGLYRSAMLQALKENQKPISDEEAKKYFQEHEEEFIQPDRVRLSLIEVGPDKEKEIYIIYKEVRAGKDFAQLARAKSIHPSSTNGGDLGFLTRKQYKDLTDVAFTLKPGQVSKPFKSPTGWQIIKVTEFVKKQELAPGEEIRRAKSRLEAMEASRAYNALMKDLKEKNKVVLYEDRIKLLDSPPQGSAPKETAAQRSVAKKGF
jgi:parvulin-like peptidyl-prolyl isomerase